MQTHLTLSLISMLIRHVGVTANAPAIVILTSFSLLDLTQVLLSSVITLNVSEQLTAILRAQRWGWTLLFRWDLGCNPPPCWIICSQRGGEGGTAMVICFLQEIMGLLLTALLSVVGIWMSSVRGCGCTGGWHGMKRWVGSYCDLLKHVL